jgi:hypothetical protein
MGASGRRGEGGGEGGGITKDREGVRGAFAGPPAREEHDAQEQFTVHPSRRSIQAIGRPIGRVKENGRCGSRRRSKLLRV